MKSRKEIFYWERWLAGFLAIFFLVVLILKTIRG
jgi:hypothetical protein